MTNQAKLALIRKDLDLINQEILDLIRKRAVLIKKIGKIKKKLKLPIRDAKREKFIIKKLKSGYEREIFKKILSQSRKLQVEHLRKRD